MTRHLTWVLTLLFLGCALAVPAIRRPATAFGPPTEPRLAEDVRVDSLRRELRAVRAEMARRDHLAAFAAQPPNGDPIAPGSELTTPDADAMRERIGPDPVDTEVRVGTLVLRRGRYAIWDETLVDSAHGRPLCLYVQVLLPGSRSLRTRAESGEDPLGPCRGWARWGAPGPRIDAWLRQGAVAFLNPRRDRPSPRAGGVRLGALGDRNETTADFLWSGCRSGRSVRCTAAFLQPAEPPHWLVLPDRDPADPSRLLHADPRWVRTSADFSPAGLFDDLVRGFGEEAVRRFWQSSEPPVVAFESSFGVEPGAWLAVWARSRGPRREAVTPGVVDVTVSVLALCVMVGLAGVVQERRRLA